MEGPKKAWRRRVSLVGNSACQGVINLLAPHVIKSKVPIPLRTAFSEGNLSPAGVNNLVDKDPGNCPAPVPARVPTACRQNRHGSFEGNSRRQGPGSRLKMLKTQALQARCAP